MIERHRIGRTIVAVHDAGEFVETRLPDGARVEAAPNRDPDSIARAHDLGYRGDVVAMTRDHDRTHVSVCEWLGLAESPALRDVAERRTPTLLVEAEEDVVMAVQRFCNLLGVAVP